MLWIKIIGIVIGAFLLVSAGYFFPSILPYHVGSAIGAYLGFILCVIWNIAIGVGRRWSSFYAKVFCEAGLIFAAATLLSGAWWGSQAWGAPWVWEPRLTGLFLMTLIFFSWRLAAGILGEEAYANRKLTASLIVLGLPAIAFTHLAARLFGGIHPTSVSSVLEQPPGNSSAAIFCAFCGCLCFGIVYILMRKSSCHAEMR